MTTDETNAEPRWLIVEIFGHREHAGRCTEEDQLGVKMLRIDEPLVRYGDKETIIWQTHWYPGSAIFSIRQTTEEAVMKRIGAKIPPAITHDAGSAIIDEHDYIDEEPDSLGG